MEFHRRTERCPIPGQPQRRLREESLYRLLNLLFPLRYLPGIEDHQILLHSLPALALVIYYPWALVVSELPAAAISFHQ